MSNFKIKGPMPTVNASIEALADYIEVLALSARNNEVSIEDVLKQLLKPSDEIDFNGIEDQEDIINEKLESVTQEIQRRIEQSNENYPYSIKAGGYIIAFNGFDAFSSYLYVYLLLATRLNMKEHKKFNNIDGTKLFEEVSAIIAESYFGDRSSAIVFGTAALGNFESKVNDMCFHLKEGGCFVNHNQGEITENDDTLDIVVWKHFKDQRPNKLIGFGQCKTGTQYEEYRHNLQPENFCKKWFKTPFNQDPIRLFFIADVMESGRFWKRGVDAGILFDRIRIMDYLPRNINMGLQQKISNWSLSAVNFACN